MRAAAVRIALFALLALIGAVSPACAITTVPRDLDQLVARADTIFRGVATAKQAAWKGGGAQRHIVTRITFRVDETLKGAAQPEQTLEFFGGEIDGQGMGVAGMPTFAPGDEAFLFVEGNGAQICPLVGADQGGFRITRAKGVERVLTSEGKSVAGAESIGRDRDVTAAAARPSSAESLTVGAFRGGILQRVARQQQGLLRVQD